MGALNTSLVDRVSGLAFGCLGMAGIASSPLVAASMTLGTVGALTFASRVKHGPESRSVMRRIARTVRDSRRQDSEYGYVEQAALNDIAVAFVTASDGAMLSPEALAKLSVEANLTGFPDRATDVILKAVSQVDPQFGIEGLAQNFAKDVLSTALHAAIEDAEYFKTLQPHLLIQTAETMGQVLYFLERMDADSVAKGRQLDEMQDTLARFADERLPSKLIIRLTRLADGAVDGTADALVTNLLSRLEAAENLISNQPKLSNLPTFVTAVEDRVVEHLQAGDVVAADTIAQDSLLEWREQKAAQNEAGRALIDTAIQTLRLSGENLSSTAEKTAELEIEKLNLSDASEKDLETAHRLETYQINIGNSAQALDIKTAQYLLDQYSHRSQPALILNACGLLHIALGELGYIDHIKFAKSCFEHALDSPFDETNYLDVAMLKNNLGFAYVTEAERGNHGVLVDALKILEDALQVCNPDKFPQLQPMIFINLGKAYFLKAKQGDLRNLEKAKTAFERALRELNQNDFPNEWSVAKNNLGHIYNIKADQGDSSAGDHAIRALNEVLDVWKQGHVPYRWAMAQINLGNAHLTLGRQGNMASLDQAIHHYSLALEEWTQDRVPMRWALIQNNLGYAFLLKTKLGGEDNLENAIEACHLALGEVTQKNAPSDWAMIQNNLGNIYLTQAETGDLEAIERAVEAYQNALKEWNEKSAPLEWAKVKSNLGYVLFMKASRFDETLINVSIDHLTDALSVQSVEHVPVDHASSQMNLSIAYAFRASRKNDCQAMTAAIQVQKIAKAIFSDYGYSPNVQRCEQNIEIYEDWLVENC